MLFHLYISIISISYHTILYHIISPDEVPAREVPRHPKPGRGDREAEQRLAREHPERPII